MYYCREVIPRMAQEIREKIVAQIGKNRYAITSDAWSKPSKFPALLRFI
jgi:hypothetical protein